MRRYEASTGSVGRGARSLLPHSPSSHHHAHKSSTLGTPLGRSGWSGGRAGPFAGGASPPPECTEWVVAGAAWVEFIVGEKFLLMQVTGAMPIVFASVLAHCFGGVCGMAHAGTTR